MRFRKLRIAWSVTCLIACLLLIAMWVRSYWVIEALGRGSRTPSETTKTTVFSNHGTLEFSRRTVQTTQEKFPVPDKWTYGTVRPQFATKYKFFWLLTNKEFMIQFPTWLPVILIAPAAAIPWLGLKWKFTVRTLLLITTLVAVVMGLVVWAARTL